MPLRAEAPERDLDAPRLPVVTDSLELPRAVSLLRTASWNLAESFGLPLGGYVLAASLWGRNAGVIAMLAAVWVTAVIAIATNNLWIFLVHFPLANLGLCFVFARTARGDSPLAARLGAEVIGLRCSFGEHSLLHRFFQRVTALWAAIFLLLAVALAALLATVPIVTYVPVWAITTITLIAVGVAASVLWFRSVLRELGIGLRFTPATTGSARP
jgi:hypothetical protein